MVVTAVCAVSLLVLTATPLSGKVAVASEFTVQVGAFNDQARADRLAGYLRGVGVDVRRLQRSPDRPAHVVVFGSYMRLDEARQAARDYRALTRRDAFGVDIATVQQTPTEATSMASDRLFHVKAQLPAHARAQMTAHQHAD